MKTVIFSGAIIILLIVSMVFVYFYTFKKTQSLQMVLNCIADAVHNENWEECDYYILQADEVWKKIRPRFELYTLHDELEELEVPLEYLKVYIAEREKTDAIIQLSTLEFGIENIVKTKKLSLQNVL